MNAPVDVSIVMPCLNEVRTLPDCIDMAFDALKVLEKEDGLSGEVVISDNGSQDGSQKLALERGARVVNCRERGYGNALIGGIKSARGRFIVMGDADASYDFREGVSMVRKLAEGYDLCMGSRMRGTIKPGAMPWKNRYIGNPVLTGILNLFFRSGLSDAHCGLRGFTREAFERIRPTSPGMEFASEIVIKASLLNLKRTEVPITLHPDKRDRAPHLRPWRDGWRHLRYLVMLSPVWLYFLPALLLLVSGLGIFVALLSKPSGEMVRVGSLLFGDHWAILAGAMIAIGHQLIILGLAATLFGVREGYRTPGRILGALTRLGSLEFMLITGTLCLLGGIAVFAYVVWVWSEGNYVNLSRVREMVVATSLMVIGLQTMFGGFLLSVVGGNEARIERIIREASASETSPETTRDPVSPA